MNRAMRRATKSKRGGKKYMQTTAFANSEINSVFRKPNMRQSLRRKQGTKTLRKSGDKGE
jgi:hypothetical protein|tara:strand:- start:101 stop:280 length:180 start_codon:yes stop_codon:yes gene_type:complete